MRPPPCDEPSGTICPYCGVGCRVVAAVTDNQVTRISAVAGDRPNFGKLCPKGGFLTRVLDTPDRLTHPQMRLDRDHPLARVSWDLAASYLAERLKRIVAEHGPESIGFYGSGQLDTEACYLSGKLFKGYLGCNNTDSNSRLCMSSAVAAYKRSLGSDGPPTCYDDIARADTFLIVGANMVENHPVLFGLIKQRRRQEPNARVIVVDPRRTPTAEQAHVHIRLRPGSDLAFLNAVARLLLDSGAQHEAFVHRHTTGFVAWAAWLRTLDPAALAAECDVPLPRIAGVAELVRQSRGLLSLYAMGANQSSVGVAKNHGIINLHLLTGQIGVPGAGPFSLTGQPNAMGGREAGYLAHQLPGYRSVESLPDRQAIERVWQLPPGSISPRPGLAATEMFDALGEGRLKAVWIAATNPAASMPDLARVQAALRRAELVIVQDIYHPVETSRYADILLPAAQWLEKTGTSTNSERLVTRSRQQVQPPGEAMPDWWILARMARAMGLPHFEYEHAEQVWDEYRAATRGTACDQWGLTNHRLAAGPLQWPCPHRFHRGTARRYTDQRFATPDRRARFFTTPHQPPAEEPCEQYPLRLTTGRILTQWHTMTRTGKVPELLAKEPDPFVEVHPDDAQRWGLEHGAWVEVASRRGLLRAVAHVTDKVAPGTLFTTFHWNDEQGLGLAANNLTLAAVDPVSKQPELKHCAVAIRAVATRPVATEDAMSVPVQHPVGASSV